LLQKRTNLLLLDHGNGAFGPKFGVSGPFSDDIGRCLDHNVTTESNFTNGEKHMFSKKSAVAAAVLLASVAAQAQVSVYGNVDASFGRFEAAVANADGDTKVQSGVHTGSFIGFKGQEDLGGGLKAFFVLESEIGLDTGAAGADAAFWGRTSELGLAGDFGTIKLGNSRSLGFLANAAYNPFPVTGLMNTSERLNTFGNYDNAITYMSPNLSGFTAAVQAGLHEGVTAGAKNDIGLALNYNAGPLAIGFNYADENDGTEDRWQLGASYDFAVAKGFLQFGQNDEEGASEKEKFFQVGVSIPVTAQGTILASYGQIKFADDRESLLSLVYDHALSKRTSAYVGLQNQRIKEAGNSESGNSFAVGIKHSF